MNMNPDNQTLMLWLEDELADAERMLVDAWASSHHEWIEKRSAAREWRMRCRGAMSSADSMPQGEFFQAQLMRTIATSVSVQTKEESVSVGVMRKWWMPMSVAAAMVMAFLGGTHWRKPQRSTTLVTYTPAEGVRAEFFESSPAEGTVIVLNGVPALPDSFVNTDISQKEAAGHHDGGSGSKESAIIVTP
jgi:hypothetical protein